MKFIFSIKSLFLFVFLLLGFSFLGSCSTSNNQGKDGVPDQASKTFTFEEIREQTERVVNRAGNFAGPLIYPELYPSSNLTLASSNEPNSLDDFPKSFLQQLESIIVQTVKKLPELATNDWWIAESSQIVESQDVSKVTDEEVVFYVIAVKLDSGFTNWGAMLIVNLDTFQILDWKVNNSPNEESDYIPLRRFLTSDEGEATLENLNTGGEKILRRVVDNNSLSINSAPSNLFKKPMYIYILDESKSEPQAHQTIF